MNKYVLATLTVGALLLGVATYFILFVDPATLPAAIGGPLATIQNLLAGVIIWLQGAWAYVITSISAIGGGVGLFNAYKTKQIAAQQVNAAQTTASTQIVEAYNVAGTAQTEVNTLTKKLEQLTAELEQAKKEAEDTGILKSKLEELQRQKGEIDMAFRTVVSPPDAEMIRRLEQKGYQVRQLVE